MPADLLANDGRSSREPSMAHDPGGKVRIALPAGMRGRAEFHGPADCYRPLLWRDWGDHADRFALWIGMNPSTADADFNDPTVAREIARTQDLGLEAYAKCNVMDLRATHPRMLKHASVPPCSDVNLGTIDAYAARAAVIVAAWGALAPALRPYADRVADLLAGRMLLCLGRTQDGSPRHPLYTRRDAPFEVWRRRT